MLVLALDTATDAVVAGVYRVPDQPARSGRDGRGLPPTTGERLGHAQHLGANAQGEQLAVMVDRAMSEAGVTPRDLDVVGVGRGPGPFTGLRVGLAFAETLGWVLDRPVHGVCTLDVIAAAARADAPVELIVATDARRREVYWAHYDADGTRLAGPTVSSPGDVPGAAELPVVGSGTVRHPDAFPHALPLRHPDAGILAELVAAQIRVGAAPDVTPLYLRRPDAVAGAHRKPVTPR